MNQSIRGHVQTAARALRAAAGVACTGITTMARLLVMVLLGSVLAAGVAQARGPAAAGNASVATIAHAELPAEARATLALIRAGGPFPYERDGIVFGNREGLLPRQARGYYREYTVPTPGARTRGARRLIVGGEPRRLAEVWYTADHYQSFRRVADPR